MDAQQGESNWAHACRVLGLDWPGQISEDRSRSTAEACGAGDMGGSPDSRATPLAVACQSRWRSTHEA